MRVLGLLAHATTMSISSNPGQNVAVKRRKSRDQGAHAGGDADRDVQDIVQQQGGRGQQPEPHSQVFLGHRVGAAGPPVFQQQWDDGPNSAAKAENAEPAAKNDAAGMTSMHYACVRNIPITGRDRKQRGIRLD